MNLSVLCYKKRAFFTPKYSTNISTNESVSKNVADNKNAVGVKNNEINIEKSATIPLTNENDSGKIENKGKVGNVEENNVVSEKEIQGGKSTRKRTATGNRG